MKLTDSQKNDIRLSIVLTISELREELLSTDNISSVTDFKIAQTEIPLFENIVKALEKSSN